MIDEFSEESWMLHHCSVEGWNGSRKADGVAGVCVASCQVNRSRWSQSSCLVWLVVAGDINSKDRNMVKGDHVQL